MKIIIGVLTILSVGLIIDGIAIEKKRLGKYKSETISTYQAVITLYIAIASFMLMGREFNYQYPHQIIYLICISVYFYKTFEKSRKRFIIGSITIIVYMLLCVVGFIYRNHLIYITIPILLVSTFYNLIARSCFEE